MARKDARSEHFFWKIFGAKPVGVPLPKSRFMPTFLRQVRLQFGNVKIHFAIAVTLHWLCTGKSHGGTQLPLVKNTRNQSQTHTFLSECLINENRSKYFPKTSKGGSRRRWRSRVRKRKRRKVKNKRHCRTVRCRQSQHHVHRSQSLHRKHTYHTQNSTQWMLLILITSDKRAQKPPHIWGVSIDGQHFKVMQKPKAMRYAFLPKRTGLKKNISDNALPASRDCRGAAAATAP